MSENQELTREEKISMAMIGNSNAEKWDEETVIGLTQEMLNKCDADGCYYVGWLLDDFGLYPDFWEYITEKFKDNKSVLRNVKRVEQKLERKLVEAMLRGDVKETTGIFTLKSKHKWVDKQQVDHSHAVDPVQINLNLKD